MDGSISHALAATSSSGMRTRQPKTHVNEQKQIFRNRLTACTVRRAAICRGCPNPRTPNVIMMAECDVRLNRDGDAQMKYILMDYVNEAGWPQLTRAEQQPWLGACKAFMEAMTDG